MRLRIAATAAMVVLAGLSAARLASAAFDEASIPIGNVSSVDGIVSGTLRFTGDRLVFYSGDRFQSNNSDLAVNFASGGSLILCPHSQVQILSANQNAGVMVAFQDGGSRQPFPMRPSDVVMTPDWRVELRKTAAGNDTATLQVSTSRSGELCLSGKVGNGAYFQVSQLLGDSVFDVTGQSSIKITSGHIENSPGGCACAASPVAAAPPLQSPVQPEAHPVAVAAAVMPASVQPPPALAAVPQAVTTPAAASPAPRRKSQHPQDVAGYVRSFIHLIFGR